MMPFARHHEPGPAPTDAELVEAVLHGRREAFSALVRRHQESLYRYGRSMGVTPEVAQDLLQDAFVRAYTRLRQCRNAERFRAWAAGIYRNLVLDYLRDVRRGEVPLDAVAASAAAPDSGVELRHDLHRALDELPSLLREAFLLRHLHGYGYDEIADITGAGASAVKMRVHRARDQLRATLQAGDALHGM